MSSAMAMDSTLRLGCDGHQANDTAGVQQWVETYKQSVEWYGYRI